MVLKQLLYIAAFGFLGLLTATLIHGIVEIIALEVIFTNPERFAETVWWQEWHLIHAIFAGSLWLSGLFGGLYLGQKWWGPYGSKPGLFPQKKPVDK